MCGPAGLMLAGTALGAMAQYRQGKFDQQVALNNAQLTEYQRRDAIQRGGSEAGAVEREGRAVAAQARTQIAAGNVGGPALDTVPAQSLVNSALDAARIRANASREAWGLASQRDDLRARARDAKKAGILGAFGTGLSGGAQAYSMYKASK